MEKKKSIIEMYGGVRQFLMQLILPMLVVVFIFGIILFDPGSWFYYKRLVHMPGLWLFGAVIFGIIVLSMKKQKGK